MQDSKTTTDEEFRAMAKILDAILPFDDKQRRRILEWAASKAFLNKKRIVWQ